MGTLFYSWQSDISSRTNRSFIKDAIEKAIRNVNRTLQLEEALRFDQDTKGVPGTPEIANTILKKIDESDILLSDMTIVARSREGKQVPNPNVLIELGYAMKSIGSGRIIAVMNEEHGAAADGLPFDLQHRRWPIRYSLSADEAQEIRKKQKAYLVTQFEEAIKAIFSSGLIPQDHPAFEPIQPQWKSSSFLTDNEKIAKRPFFDEEDDIPDVIWINGPQAFLRLIPTAIIPLRSPFELEKLMQSNPILRPMGRTSMIWTARNKHGTVVYVAKENQVNTDMITEVFRNGEIWGIDAHPFREGHSYIPSGYIGEIFTNALQRYLSFARKSLELALPLKFIAGISGVEDFPISTSIHSTGGHCVDDEVVFEGIIDAYDVPPRTLLLPFFERIWEACGFDYPEHSE